MHTLLAQSSPWQYFLVGGLSWIAGLISGSLIAIFAEPIRQRLYRPRLVLDFDASADCLSKTPMREGDRSLLGLVVRIKVRNESNAIARDCRAYLIDVEQASDIGTFTSTVYCDSLQLGWSCHVEEDRRFGGIDIPRGVNQFVDVVATKENVSVLIPQIRPIPYRYVDLFQMMGEFRWTLQVSAAGTNPATIRLILRWAGLWDRIEVQRSQ